MGMREWESGTIVLPSAEFAKVRQAVQSADAELKEAVFARTQECWKGLTRKQTTDPEAYRAAVYDWLKVQRDKARERGYVGSSEPDPIAGAAYSMMYHQCGNPPRRVLKADMDLPTNRTTVFRADQGSMSFDRATNTVEWDVDSSSWAVERARGSVQGRALFGALGKVRWTRDTGGLLTGGNENADGEGPAKAWGPVGALAEPSVCEPYTDSKGNRVTQEMLSKMYANQLTAQMAFHEKLTASQRTALNGSGAQPRGHNGHAGQFTYKDHAEPTFRL